MKIVFSAAGLSFEAQITYTPGDEGCIYGPPEQCYEPEPCEIEFESLKCGDVDALFLLDSTLEDEIYEAAAEAAEKDSKLRRAKGAELEYDERDCW